MVEFFRDRLDGVLYVIVALFALFLIMAIIGFIMERLKLEKEANEKVAHVGRGTVTPIQPVSIEISNEQVLEANNTTVQNIEVNENLPAVSEEPVEEFIIENYFKEPSNDQLNQDINVPNQQSTNVIVFEDPDTPNE